MDEEEKFVELDPSDLTNSAAIKTVILVSHNGERKELEIEDGILLICDTKEGHMLSYMQGGIQYAAHCLNIHLSMMIKPFVPDTEMATLYEVIVPLRDKVLDKLADIAIMVKGINKTTAKTGSNLRSFERRLREYNDKSN